MKIIKSGQASLFMETNLNENVESSTPPPGRNVVNLLTTLTFIGSILGFAFCIMSFMFWGGLETVLLKDTEESVHLKQQIVKMIGDQRYSTYEFNGKREAFFISMSYYYLLASFANVLSVVGAFLMRAYKRKGFFIYVFSHLLFFVSPFLLVLDYEARWGETAVLALFAGLFVFLYSRQLKHFH